MRFMMLLITGVVLCTGIAQAEIIHSGYCSEFETRNGCVESYSSSTYQNTCSCPGEPTPPPPPFTGTRCGPANHMTGDRSCCSYTNGVQNRCWVE